MKQVGEISGAAAGGGYCGISGKCDIGTGILVGTVVGGTVGCGFTPPEAQLVTLAQGYGQITVTKSAVFEFTLKDGLAAAGIISIGTYGAASAIDSGGHGGGGRSATASPILYIKPQCPGDPVSCAQAFSLSLGMLGTFNLGGGAASSDILLTNALRWLGLTERFIQVSIGSWKSSKGYLDNFVLDHNVLLENVKAY